MNILIPAIISLIFIIIISIYLKDIIDDIVNKREPSFLFIFVVCISTIISESFVMVTVFNLLLMFAK
jgi:hypothetical protein